MGLCLKILSFDLNIFLPFEICSDFLMKCSALNLLPFVWRILLMTFKTNIYLLFPPYLIAMACIFIVCQLDHLNHAVDFEIFMRTFHIPLDNITEVTRYIIKHCFVIPSTNGTKNTDTKLGKEKGSVPVNVLKAIDLFYCSNN